MVRLVAGGDVVGKALIWTVSNEDSVDPDEDGVKFNFVAPPGTYRVKLYAIGLAKDGKTTKETAVPHTVKIAGGSPVPPDPGPNPPNPPVPPAPITKAWVVVVEETREAAATRNQFFGDEALQQYVVKKGWKLRTTDKDVKDADGNTPSDLKPYVDYARDKTRPWMFVVDQAGTVRHNGTLPETPAALLAVLKKVGGE
jgi:hypothetical protein